jgi:GT2 family glycosyltransferase
VYHVKRQYLGGIKNKQTDYKYLADPEKCERVFNDPHGGVTICKTAAVRYVRGFNELFWSWGGEDTEFVMRTVKLGLKVVRIKSPLIHFHHTRTHNCFPSKKFALLSQLEQEHIMTWSPARLKQYMGLADVGDYTSLTHPRVYEDDRELIKKAEEKLEPYKHLFT